MKIIVIALVVAILSLQLLGVVFGSTAGSSSAQVISTHSRNKAKIAFGSCNKFYSSHKSDIFNDVAAQRPDVWVWLGDIAYLDNIVILGWFKPDPDFNSVNTRLSATKNDLAYQTMLKQVNAEVGVWDDHDYGLNNSGESFVFKHQMRQSWLNFFDEPVQSERRTRASGIYTSYYVGEQKRLKLILTDVRWNRTPEDILGEDQWKWLEDQLAEASVELFLIGSGSQFLPDDRFVPETWDTTSKERLYQIINRTNASVVFLTGDVHYGEIMQHPCSKKKVGYELVEITSSGLSFYIDNSGPGIFYIANRFIFTPTYNDKSDRFSGKNYGLVEIDWDEGDLLSTRISLRVHTIDSEIPVLERVYELRQLKRSAKETRDHASKECVVDDISPYDRWSAFVKHSIIESIATSDYKLGFYLIIRIIPFWLLFKFYGYLIRTVFSNPDEDQKEKIL